MKVHATPLRDKDDRTSPLRPVIDPFTGQPYDRTGQSEAAAAIDALRRSAGIPLMPGSEHPDSADEIDALKVFLASADQRWKKAKAEADAARSDLARMKAAWLNAVGGRLLWRPDLIAALAETTTDMRIRLDELDEETAGARLSAMEAEYGPFIALPAEEDA